MSKWEGANLSVAFDGVSPYSCFRCGRMPRMRHEEKIGERWWDPFVTDLYRLQCTCGLYGPVRNSMKAATEEWNEFVKENEMEQTKKEENQLSALVNGLTVMTGILARGNDIEIRSKKDGLQILEVTKKTKYST